MKREDSITLKEAEIYENNIKIEDPQNEDNIKKLHQHSIEDTTLKEVIRKVKPSQKMIKDSLQTNKTSSLLRKTTSFNKGQKNDVGEFANELNEEVLKKNQFFKFVK